MGLGRELAIRRAGAGGTIVETVVALLGALNLAVAAIRGKGAPRRASPVGTVIERSAHVALLGGLLHAVAAIPGYFAVR